MWTVPLSQIFGLTLYKRALFFSPRFLCCFSLSLPIFSSSLALWATAMNKDGSYNFPSPWKHSTPRDLGERSWRQNLRGMFRHASEEQGTAMPLFRPTVLSPLYVPQSTHAKNHPRGRICALLRLEGWWISEEIGCDVRWSWSGYSAPCMMFGK